MLSYYLFSIFFHAADGDNMFFRNIGKDQPEYTVSYPRRFHSSWSLRENSKFHISSIYLYLYVLTVH
jgi:hypothetical protein